MSELLLGSGWLNWDSGERISGRYGTVTLRSQADPEANADSRFPNALIGESGKLYATVLAADPRVVAEVLPVGSVELLGEGELFREVSWHDAGGPGTEFEQIGVIPADGCAEEWLDPETLRLLHGQQVELSFHPHGPPPSFTPGRRSRRSPLAAR